MTQRMMSMFVIMVLIVTLIMTLMMTADVRMIEVSG